MPSRRRRTRTLAENLQQSLRDKFSEQYPDLDISVTPPGSFSWIFRRARSPRLQVALKENAQENNSSNISNFIDEINTLPNASRFGFGIEKLTDSSSGKKVTYKITNPRTLKAALDDRPKEHEIPLLRASQGGSEPPIVKETAENLQQSLRDTFSQQYPNLSLEVTSPSKSAWLLKRARSPRLRVTLRENSSQKGPNAINNFIEEINQLPNASEFGIEKLTDSPLGERVKYKITSPDALQRALESEAYERDALAMAAQNNETPLITKEIVAVKLQSLVSDFLAQEKRQSSPLRKSVSMIERTLNSRIVHHSAPEALDTGQDLKFVFKATPPTPDKKGIGYLHWHASVILPLNQFNTFPHSLLEEWQRVGYFSGRWEIKQPTKEDLEGLDTKNTSFKIHIPFINVGRLFKEEIAAGMYRIQQPDNELPLRQAPPPPSILVTYDEEDDRATVPPPPSLVIAQDNKRPKSLHSLKVPSPEKTRKVTDKKKKVRAVTSPTILPDEIKKDAHPSNTTSGKTRFSEDFIYKVHQLLDEMAGEYPTHEAFLNSVDGVIEEILSASHAPDIQPAELVNAPEEPKHIPTIAPGIKENPFIRWDELQRQQLPQSSSATMGETRRFLPGEKPLSFDRVVEGFIRALPLETGRVNSNRFIRRDALAKELAGIVQQRQENSETTTRFSPRNVLLQDVKQMAQNHPEARIENVETFVRELTSHRSL